MRVKKKLRLENRELRRSANGERESREGVREEKECE